MKKVRHWSNKAEQKFFSAEIDHRSGSRRRLELALRTRRSSASG